MSRHSKRISVFDRLGPGNDGEATTHVRNKAQFFIIVQLFLINGCVFSSSIPQLDTDTIQKSMVYQMRDHVIRGIFNNFKWYINCFNFYYNKGTGKRSS